MSDQNKEPVIPEGAKQEAVAFIEPIIGNLIESIQKVIVKIALLNAQLAAVTADRDRWEQMHGNAIKEAKIAENEIVSLKQQLYKLMQNRPR
jgi:hypothetical protein